nr:hypothetical protein [Rhodobacter sp. CZR27]
MIEQAPDGGQEAVQVLQLKMHDHGVRESLGIVKACASRERGNFSEAEAGIVGIEDGLAPLRGNSGYADHALDDDIEPVADLSPREDPLLHDQLADPQRAEEFPPHVLRQVPEPVRAQQDRLERATVGVDIRTSRRSGKP